MVVLRNYIPAQMATCSRAVCQEKPGRSCELQGVHHVIACSACSQTGAGSSNGTGENSGGEHASTCRTFRGGWGQRAGKDQSRNLGDPAGRERKRPTAWRESITANGPGRESERPIVARKRVTPVERRGLTGNMFCKRREIRLDENPTTEESGVARRCRKRRTSQGCRRNFLC